MLLGTFSSRITFAQTSVAEQNKMLYPIPSGVALQIYERGYKYIFNFQPNAAEYLGKSYTGLMKDLVKPDQMPKKAAVVYADDFYANAAVAGLTGKKREIAGTDKVIDLAPGTLAEAGIEVVLEQQWPEEGFSDWIGLANSIKAKRRRHGGRVHRLARRGDPAHARLQHGRLSAFDGHHGTGHAGRVPRSGRRCRRTACMIHSAWHPAVQWEGVLAGKPFSNQNFIDAFKAKFGKDPDEDNAIPFATCQGMAQAIAATNSTDNTVLRDWLAARTADDPVKTILGDFHWDEKGLPLDKAFLITQWQDGELKFVYPVGQFPGTSDLVWPKPLLSATAMMNGGPGLPGLPFRTQAPSTGAPWPSLKSATSANRSAGSRRSTAAPSRSRPARSPR